MGHIRVPAGAAAPTPPAGQLALYAKGDKKPYCKDDTGLETPMFGGAGAVVVGPPNAIFVDPVSGNDGTGARGDASKPFLTIAAAFTATGLTAGDVIVLYPGDHNIAVTPPEIGVSSIAILGYGKDLTRVVCAVNAGFVVATTASLNSKLVMRGMTIVTGVTDTGVSVSGAGGGGTFMGAGVVLEDVHFDAAGTGYALAFCERIALRGVTCSGSATIDTCGPMEDHGRPIRDCHTGNLSLSFDDDSLDKPAAGRERIEFQDCTFGSILLDTQPMVRLFGGSVVTIASLSPLTESTGGRTVFFEWEEVHFLNPVFSPITALNVTLDDTVAAHWFRFDRVIADGGQAFSIARTGSVNGTSGASFTHIAPGFAVGLFSGEGVDMRVRAWTGSIGLNTLGTGTLTPGEYTGVTGLLAAGPNVVVLPFVAIGSPNFIQVTTNVGPAGETLQAAGFPAPNLTIVATIGGGTATYFAKWNTGL